ncbi:MAG: 6-hydroxymethylpterin diphosphokinase MptE-like protein [bacterium]
MELFDENLAAVSRLDPDLVDRLRSGEEDESVVTGGTPEGAPTLGILRNGKTFLLHHPQNPLADTRNMIASMAGVKSAWNFAVVGLGLGYVPLLLLEGRTHPPDLLLLVEPSISVFREACKNVDLRPVLRLQACCLLVGQPPATTYEALMSNLTRILANQVTVIQHPPTKHLYPDWMEEQEARIRDVWRFGESSLASKHRDGQQYVVNLLQNLPAFTRSRGIRAGRSVLRGVPAVIVAGGPSLRKNIDKLPELRKHALMIGVDTALDRLIEAGVPPHLVVTVDPSDLNLRHFRQESYSSVRLAFDPECYPISNRFGDETLTYTTDKADFFVWLDKALGPKGTIVKGGMVSQAGFYLARYWGCDPIALIGQDLALDPQTGETHHSQAALVRTVRWVEGDSEHVDYPAVDHDFVTRREQLFWVPGVVEAQVPTVHNLLSYLRLVERDVAHTSARVIDATEGGARIAGTDILSADDVIRLVGDRAFDFEPFWNRLERSGSSSEKALTAAKQDIQRRLNRCAECAARGREILAGLNTRPITVQEIAQQMDPLRSYIFDDPISDYFIEQVASTTLFEFLKRGPADADNRRELEESRRRYTALIDATFEACEKLRDFLKQME